MRLALSKTLEELLVQRKDTIFISGDLGFNAFEKLRHDLGHRFINAGVAEQNMVGMAAGLASQGFLVFVYSIAPFIYARAFEQIRNDVCFHNLPVFFIGNGGGFGYGIMGSSHHAIDDIAIMSTLQNLKCYVPAFKKDVETAINEIILNKKPAYLRLGLGIEGVENEELWLNTKCINKCKNPKITVFTQGPVLHNLLSLDSFKLLNNEIDLFLINSIPFELPDLAIESIRKSKKVLCFDEHIQTGGLSEKLALHLMKNKLTINDFQSISALPYPSGKYGSQKFHQKESGLDGENIVKCIQKMMSQ